MELRGKRAVITGGGRGIGRAIAVGFAAAGADVCLIARTPSQLQEAAAEIRQIGRRVVALPCDVAELDQVERAVSEAAAELGGIDLLVNNAGGGSLRQPVGHDDPHAWRQVLEVNLLGVYYFSRAVLPWMRQAGGGSIINVGSGMGHEARPANSSYHTAKAAVWMFTRCLAVEVWQDKIAVNELVPGPVHTQLTAELFAPQQQHPLIASEWVKEPRDVVPLALFLASQGPHGPTGQSFSLARRPW